MISRLGLEKGLGAYVTNGPRRAERFPGACHNGGRGATGPTLADKMKFVRGFLRGGTIDWNFAERLADGVFNHPERERITEVMVAFIYAINERKYFVKPQIRGFTSNELKFIRVFFGSNVYLIDGLGELSIQTSKFCINHDTNANELEGMLKEEPAPVAPPACAGAATGAATPLFSILAANRREAFENVNVILEADGTYTISFKYRFWRRNNVYLVDETKKLIAKKENVDPEGNVQFTGLQAGKYSLAIGYYQEAVDCSLVFRITKSEVGRLAPEAPATSPLATVRGTPATSTARSGGGPKFVTVAPRGVSAPAPAPTRSILPPPPAALSAAALAPVAPKAEAAGSVVRGKVTEFKWAGDGKTPMNTVRVVGEGGKVTPVIVWARFEIGTEVDLILKPATTETTVRYGDVTKVVSRPDSRAGRSPEKKAVRPAPAPLPASPAAPIISTTDIRVQGGEAINSLVRGGKHARRPLDAALSEVMRNEGACTALQHIPVGQLASLFEEALPKIVSEGAARAEKIIRGTKTFKRYAAGGL